MREVGKMKKIINEANQVVDHMIEGMLATSPDLYKRLEDKNVITRKNAPTDGKVAIISGGGSGHEPAHTGYVGKGMLDAAVIGEVFTSPSAADIYETIKAVDSGSGVFLIIKNYAGDVMNFEMAREFAEAEGIQIDQIIVRDDIAVEDSIYTVGRRGIAGTIFVHKIIGALAETGASLAKIKEVAEQVVKNVRSIGVATNPCTIPAVGEPTFTLEDDEIEIGIGIHGEPGIERRKMMSASEIATYMLDRIFADIEINSEDDVAVLINGLGATPEMELYIIQHEVEKILREKGINIYRAFVGEYMTALEMGGCSVTLLKLEGAWKELLDAPSDAKNFFVRS